jgi:hypothetical protein
MLLLCDVSIDLDPSGGVVLQEPAGGGERPPVCGEFPQRRIFVEMALVQAFWDGRRWGKAGFVPIEELFAGRHFARAYLKLRSGTILRRPRIVACRPVSSIHSM